MRQVLKEVGTPLALFCLGLLLGWRIYRCDVLPAEPPAPAIHQTDGSLILERSPAGRPAAEPDKPTLKPAGELPKGAVVERNVEVVVRPDSSRPVPDLFPRQGTAQELPIPAVQDLSGAFQCPDVTVDLSLIKLKDQTQRVIASSPDGKVIGGLDVPISRQEFPKPQRWTAQGMVGYDRNRGQQVYGGQVSRNIGPFTLSVGAVGGTVFAGAGIHF